MKLNQLATLVLRLFGVYCLIQGVPILGALAPMVAYAERADLSVARAIVMAVLPGASMLVVGILLLAFSVPLGARLAGSSDNDAGIASVSFEQVQMLAFAAAGILIFSDSLPQLLRSLNYLGSRIASKDERNNIAWAYHLSETAAAVGTLLKAILGVVLFFGARGFANWWRSLRTFATPKPPQVTQ